MRLVKPNWVTHDGNNLFFCIFSQAHLEFVFMKLRSAFVILYCIYIKILHTFNYFPKDLQYFLWIFIRMERDLQLVDKVNIAAVCNCR